jgi:hemerythrin
MVLMNWDDSFSVKVTEIDEQHKKLILLINNLYDAMMQGKGKDVLGSILSELANYTVTHFGTEEKYFDKFNYENTLPHKLEHKKFVEKVTEFKTKFDSGNATITIDLMNFLKDWLVNHIKGTDQKYSNCFNENGLN